MLTKRLFMVMNAGNLSSNEVIFFLLDHSTLWSVSSVNFLMLIHDHVCLSGQYAEYDPVSRKPPQHFFCSFTRFCFFPLLNIISVLLSWL